MIIDEDLFFADILPGFLSTLFEGKATCHAVFQTTRRVGAHHSGLDAPSKPGLLVEIHDGLSRQELFDLSGGLASLFGQKIDQAIIQHTQALAANMPAFIPVPGPAVTLLVKYLSFTGLDEDLQKLDQICSQNPGIQIILVTCTCDVDEKIDRLSSQIKQRDIAHLVITNACGGGRVMGRIRDDIIAAWPNK